MNYLLLVKQRFWMILTYEFETILWWFFFWLIQKNQLEVFCSWIGLYGSRLCVWWMQETLVYALDIWQKCIQSHLDCRQWQNDLIVCFFLHFWQFSSLFGDLAWRWTVPRNGVCFCFTFPLFSDLCWLTHSAVMQITPLQLYFNTSHSITNGYGQIFALFISKHN